MKSSPFWKKLREYFSIYLPKQRNSSEKTIGTGHMAWNLLLRYLLQERGMTIAAIEFGTFTAEQQPDLVFYNIFRLFIVVSTPAQIVSSTF